MIVQGDTDTFDVFEAATMIGRCVTIVVNCPEGIDHGERGTGSRTLRCRHSVSDVLHGVQLNAYTEELPEGIIIEHVGLMFDFRGTHCVVAPGAEITLQDTPIADLALDGEPNPF